MGKNLKGRELGKGLYQRKDGRYGAKAMIDGRKINLYDWDLKRLKKRFAEDKEKLELEFDYIHKEYTLDQWFYEWLELYKRPYLKESSVNQFVVKYKNSFGKRIGNRKIKNIRNVDIQYVINELQREGRASSTVRDALGRLSDCIETARMNGMISINPCFDIKVAWKPKSVSLEALTREEQRLLLRKSNESWYREFVYTMFLTGLRIGEIGALKWEDVDWKNKCINIQRSLQYEYHEGTKKLQFTSPKTINSYRRIPFMGELEDILKSQKEKDTTLKKELGKRFRGEGEFDDMVFITTMGSPVNRIIAEREIHKIAKDANEEEKKCADIEQREPVVIPYVTPHIIRHTFATRCFEQEMDPKVVQKIMGHAYYSTTIDIYTHVVADKMWEESRKFEYK